MYFCLGKKWYHLILSLQVREVLFHLRNPLMSSLIHVGFITVKDIPPCCQNRSTVKKKKRKKEKQQYRDNLGYCINLFK